MHRTLPALLLLLLLSLCSCANPVQVTAPLAEPIAKGRAAAIVMAEEMVVGTPLTQEQKTWADFNAEMWDELFDLVKTQGEGGGE